MAMVSLVDSAHPLADVPKSLLKHSREWELENVLPFVEK